MNKRFLAVLFSIVLILSVTVAVILTAKGYRPNFDDKTMDITGILVATSDPDGASVYLNNKLTTATNTTLNLKPGSYDVKISKDGYYDWQKKIEIKKEEVFKTNAFLFPRASDLRPITLNGVTNPTLSPDESRVAFTVASASATATGIYTLSMSGIPVINNVNIRQIFRDNGLALSKVEGLIWSADDTQLIASQSGKYYMLDTDKMTVSPTIISNTQLEVLKTGWQQETDLKAKSQLSKLQISLPIKNFKFSPDETKILYTASSSATLPAPIINLPGSNPTPEVRSLISGSTYVYDLKEDRNYLINAQQVQWFVTSRHLVINEGKQISIMEYDGTNKAVVYAGPFVDNYVFVWPNWAKIIILTNLNTSSTVGENLYTINLR
ncbi:MAG: PEGA domain-containing protein [bacterium]|nr:PEGA domain-containing protein [bacterium]